MSFNESNLPKIIANAAIGRTTTQTIEYVKAHLQEEIRSDWSFVVENATINILKNTKRRRAQLIEGQYDLLAPFNVPSIVSADSVPGTKEKLNKAFPDMSKAWLKSKIEELRNKRTKRDVELEELEKVFEAIDPHCEDGEAIAMGLRRAHQI